MKLNEILAEAMSTIADREEWAAAVQEAGAEELLQEVGDEEYPTDIHLYAVGGFNRLFGTWNMRKNEGTIFHGKGLTFDKRMRKFEKVSFV